MRAWQADFAGGTAPDHGRCAEAAREAERACVRLMRALGDTYNSLVVAWPEIARLASAVPAPTQQEML